VLTRRFLLGAAGYGAAAALTGCGSERPAPEAMRGSITVRDQRGRWLSFPHTVERMVAIPPPAAAMLIAVDGGVDHIVGMHRTAWLTISSGVLGRMFPQAKAIAHDVAARDGTPDVGRIQAVDPDAILQRCDQGTGIVRPLEHAGLRVVGLRYGRQQDVDAWLTLFGALLGKRTRAKHIVSRMHARLAEMRSVEKPSVRPRVVYLDQFTGGFAVAGKGTYADFCIRLVGAGNPAAGRNGVAGTGGVDPGQLAAWDPEVLLLGNSDPAMPADAYRSAALARTTAVRAKRVYKVPVGGYPWDPPSHESPLMWQWLSMVAVPTWTGFDLRGQIVSDYRFLYGHAPTSAEIDTILWTRHNDGSVNYEQFHA
jgi:iron complex transport system substrate-binding protein